MGIGAYRQAEVEARIYEVAALGIELEVMSDTCLSDARIEVDEEVDPTFHDDVDIVVGKTPVTVNGRIGVRVVFVIWSGKDRECKDTDGNHAGYDGGSHFDNSSRP
jgi:hypothetical protein